MKIGKFQTWLMEAEKSPLTVEKYLRDVESFIEWLGTRKLEKLAVLEFKRWLVERYAVASVNSILSAVNCYLSWLGREECRVKTLKVQRQTFCSGERELSKTEYRRLLWAAAERDSRLWLLLQTLGATGIRVSEHRFLTVEAICQGWATVQSKGKTRTVFIPKKLCKSLLRYAKSHGIETGPVFVSRTGTPLDRSRIWAMMKGLCASAGVSEKKVFPHNLRHLFARLFYAMERDIVRLADILGHSSINTTRIYTAETGVTHRKQIEKMSMLLIT